MLFNSYAFIFIFLPIVLFIFYKIPIKMGIAWKIMFLSVSSLVFYAQWNIKYVPLLLASILFNFAFGRVLNARPKKAILAMGVGGNFLLLVYFKYMSFFMHSWNTAFSATLPAPEIILPLGISFFTFTQTAYLIDIYRGEAQKCSFPVYCLFITIFPHLIAGPILYHKKMIPQFYKLQNFVFSYENMTHGFMWFVIGLFKKVILADNLSPLVKLVFDYPYQITFLEAWTGAVAYTLQLYYDFSGYSEMAIGLGLMLNFHLPINFRSPYKAASIIDFWRRWHMTLSEFLKNYLYIPLGGNRHGERVKMRNLLITMLMGGLWHGAGWTFVIWGGLHGVYLVINHVWRKQSFRLPHVLNWALTFFCVVIAFVFFRADTVDHAIRMVTVMFDVTRIVLPIGGVWDRLGIVGAIDGVAFGRLYHWYGLKEVLVLALLLFATVHLPNMEECMAVFRPNWKWLLTIAALFVIAVACMGQSSEFLYFQF